MQCYLVVSNMPLPEIPEQYRSSSIMLSGVHACVVGHSSITTEEIARAFKLAAGIEGGQRGMVAKLTDYSGSDAKEVVDRLREIEAAP